MRTLTHADTYVTSAYVHVICTHSHMCISGMHTCTMHTIHITYACILHALHTHIAYTHKMRPHHAGLLRQCNHNISTHMCSMCMGAHVTQSYMYTCAHTGRHTQGHTHTAHTCSVNPSRQSCKAPTAWGSSEAAGAGTPSPKHRAAPSPPPLRPCREAWNTPIGTQLGTEVLGQ